MKKPISISHLLYISLSGIVLLIALLPIIGFGQTKLLDDKETSRLILQAMDSTYNLNFEAAEQLTARIEKRIPQHPAVYLLKAFQVNVKHIPLREGSPRYDQFEKLLWLCIEESKKLLEKDKNDVEGIFFSMASHGYLAQLYADNGKNMKALGEAKSAYFYIKTGFDYIDLYPEFYFSSGLFNYYREKYPEVHPYFKTVAWVFRSGDKELGIEMLKKGANSAIFTRTECLTYLLHINLRYENQPTQSLQYAETLINLYPSDLIYTAMYVENLVRLKQYYAALPDINRLRNNDKAFFRYIGEIFYGNYLEIALFNMKDALAAYHRADRIAKDRHMRTPHYDSMLYLGFGRVNKKMNEEQIALSYFKKAAKSAEYSAQMDEAEYYLK